jgi:Holliday junction resolvase RusA-like endonuclease
MDKEINWYILEVNPEPWAIGPVGVGRKNDRPFPIVGRNQQLDAYKRAVQESLGDDYLKVTGRVTVTFFFWRRRDAYTTPLQQKHRKHDADATNLQKATEDALQGYLYDNDKDNVHVESHLVEQGPNVNGKVVIRVARREGFDPSLLPDFVWEEIHKIDKHDDPTEPPPSWSIDTSVF